MMIENDGAAEFEVVVWGASGFTGKIVVSYLLETYGCDPEKLRWAIAGRDETKLKSVQRELGAEAVPLLLADSRDRSALDQLVSQTE